jgi:hypothetical protein
MLLATGVVLAVTSRILIVFAGLPSILNFVHFPLVFAAYLLSRTRPVAGSIRTTEHVLLVSGVLMVASLVGSTQASFLRAALLWPILVEPILIILTIWHLCAAGQASHSFRRLGVALVLVQLPIALAQAAATGLGDSVQGTLIGSGAGHHVLGAMGLIAALVALASIVSGERRVLSLTGAVVVAGFILAVLTDMKQGIAVFFIAAAFVLVVGLNQRFRSKGMGRARRMNRLAVGMLPGLAISTILIINLFVILAEEPWRFNAPLEAKAAAVETISAEMNQNPMAYLIGLGPGTTATRIAWLSGPNAPESSLQGLGLEPTPIALELSTAWASNPRWEASSVSSPFSTWIGVYGDLGLLGLGALLVLWWLPWKAAGRSPSGLGAKAVIVFTLLLGLVFNWMEEPTLMIIAAVFIGAQSARPGVLPRGVDAEVSIPNARTRGPNVGPGAW